MKYSETRDHLVKTTMMLLKDVYELEEITVRKIAEEANVSVGLINYYFDSKDDLLLDAINSIIHTDSRSGTNSLYNSNIDPRRRLQLFLHDLSDLLVDYRQYTNMTIKHELINKGFETASFIESVIHEINPEWTIDEVKYLSIQVIVPLQIIFFKEDAFYEYIKSEKTYYEIIDTILGNLGLL